MRLLRFDKIPTTYEDHIIGVVTDIKMIGLTEQFNEFVLEGKINDKPYEARVSAAFMFKWVENAPDKYIRWNKKKAKR